jgi:hypothetical protein
MTQESEGGYARAQDPWAGSYEPGVASVPTDPIPQQYMPPPPAEPDNSEWAPPSHAPAPKRHTGRTIGLVVLAVVLAGGAGYGAYYVTASRTGTPQGQGSSNPPSTTPATSPTRSKLDPHTVTTGECVYNYSTDPNGVDLGKVACTMSGSYKVIKIVSGTSLIENAKGEFDQKTADAGCLPTKYQTFYTYKDPVSDTQDLLFCMTDNP